jgi:phosphoribosylaminoimidazolecarboxamide formyltransferase/IMP cyclohydrolase
MVKIRRALVSVSDKKGILEFVKGLAAHGVHIISTGGTAALLKQNGVAVTEISDYTGFPEMMDGRVKTLHPKVHGGLLAVRDNADHKEAMERHGIQPIDMVVVNLYPFEATIAKPNVRFEDAIENIDIGGPSMLRSAAKNHRFVAVIVNPDRYPAILDELKNHGGALSEETLASLAREAFGTTAAYDGAIARYLNRVGGVDFPERISFPFVKKSGLRYGENPHQKAAFYVDRSETEPSVSTAEFLHGKELSYNNIVDLDAALELVKEFEEPTVTIIKHTNPCGTSSAGTLAEAFRRAYEADPQSAFGGIVAASRAIDEPTAALMAAPGEKATKFIECIIAPDFAPEALRVLTTVPKWKNSVRLLRVGDLTSNRINKQGRYLRTVVGGLLVQSRDVLADAPSAWRVVTKRQPSASEMTDLAFAWLIVKHVKSNAIVLAKDKTAVGVGAGQMSRVESSVLAARMAKERAKGSVLASDAMFPFRDGVDAAANVGATAVIQPGGSVKDDEVIAAANEHGLAMIFTGMRHFRH